METVKFEELRIGQRFECDGDVFINYAHPKRCKCIKDSESTASEIDGISFGISGSDWVWIKDEVFFGECNGIDIGYDFSQIDGDTDCVVMQQGESQIDCTFGEMEYLGENFEGWNPKPFGAWKVKRNNDWTPSA